ncbi:MAG: alpha/beta fold hydrolase [Isosphaeraceae bacterium]
MVVRFVAGFRPAILSAAILATAVSVGSSSVRAALDPKAAAVQEIVYTKAGSAELKLDLMSPTEGEGPFPAVLVIHGGAWRTGNKADVRPIMPDFVRHGYVAISPQYRFCPKEIFPAQVHDVKAAVRWIKANAKKYRIDPDRIGAIGFSAGGHLALMLGLTAPSDGLEGESATAGADSRVKAVVNFFGPTDLAAKDIPAISEPLVKDFLGGTPAEKPDAARKASPLTYVSKDDAPVLTFQGTKDPLVPYTQAVKLAQAMSTAGVPGRVELMVGASHGWGGAEMERTTREAFAFFDRYLKDGKAKAKP